MGNPMSIGTGAFKLLQKPLEEDEQKSLGTYSSETGPIFEMPELGLQI
jgi:hypothetical protein